MNSERHAYLIMAHNDFSILERLLLLLDDSRNDIYLHIDKKVEIFDFDYYRNLLKHAGVYFTPRVSVSWGDFSQVEAELILLRSSVPRHYMYYHLLSGVDLPLKNQDYIHSFFANHAGKEFIRFSTDEFAQRNFERVTSFHFHNALLNTIMRCYRYVCRKFHLKQLVKKRWDYRFEFCVGSAWFSITNDFANYILRSEEWVKQNFYYAACPDESVMQTLAWNSDFKKNLFSDKRNDCCHENMRLVDFVRGDTVHGRPYVFRQADYDELMLSEYLFARKFSTAIDSNIIGSIFDTVSENNSKQ